MVHMSIGFLALVGAGVLVLVGLLAVLIGRR